MLRNNDPLLRRAWHPVLLDSELGGEPVRVELLGEGWVVVRSGGTVSAFPDRCPHRNSRLSDGAMVDGCLQCPYHGWEFDASGACTHIPALGRGAAVPPTARLEAARVQVRHGVVWLAPDEPVCDVIDVPLIDDPAMQVMWVPCAEIHAAAGQFIDNFLDFGHFPFVHAGTFGAGEDEAIHPYDVLPDTDGWGFAVEYEHSIRNNEDPLVATGEHPLVQPRSMRYEYRAPFAATLRLELPLTGMVNVIAIFLQPIDAGRSRLYCLMVRNDCPTQQQQDDAVDYELAVLAEDLRVIEQLWDKEIPLDAGHGTPQTHTRADRNTVEFRRIMKRLLAD